MSWRTRKADALLCPACTLLAFIAIFIAIFIGTVAISVAASRPDLPGATGQTGMPPEGGRVQTGAPVSASQIIREYCQRLESQKNITVCATCVASHRTIPAFYKAMDYRPVWQDRDMADALLEEISRIDEEGLIQQDYYYGILKELRAKAAGGLFSTADPRDVADFDILMSDALLRLCHHLFFGKLNPEGLDPNWNLERNIRSLSPTELMVRIVSSGRIGEELDRLRPKGRYYSAVKEELKRMRGIRARGGWQPVTGRRLLRPGRKSDQVEAISRRLLAEGIISQEEFDAIDLSSGRYTEPLVSYVKRFQRRYALNADGIIGPKTYWALSRTPDDLINTLKVNLERARWVLHDLPEEYLLVNIASFRLYYVRHGSRIWRSRVQVGTASWQTPVFKADLKYVVFNPYWNVPPDILKREVIPNILEDPGYLEANQMEVVDFNGNPVDPDSIDWAAYSSGKNFPYMVRQKPGPDNALGLVKFLFPNKHHVFIHDTPSKAFFQKDKRAFSHGCIRLEEPLILAELLLSSINGMSKEEVQEIVASGKNKTVRLERFLPVLVLYWTAELDDSGQIVYLEDIYHRDERILIGLETPYSLEVSPYRFIKARAQSASKAASHGPAGPDGLGPGK